MTDKTYEVRWVGLVSAKDHVDAAWEAEGRIKQGKVRRAVRHYQVRQIAYPPQAFVDVTLVTTGWRRWRVNWPLLGVCAVYVAVIVVFTVAILGFLAGL